MQTSTPDVRYTVRRAQIETYFDRTAVEAWRRLTSDAPLGRVRATVRAGRDRMRATMLGWLPDDLSGMRVLDAGCGTGAMAVELARRGADVLAIDLSEQLIELARERCPRDLGAGRIDFQTGDLLDASLGIFDHMVAMDSLIHYETADVVRVLDALAPRIRSSMIFTYAPSTPPLAVMHAVGRLFPRGNRAPAIVPVRGDRLRSQMEQLPALSAFRPEHNERVKSGFYFSEATAWVRSCDR